MLMTAFAVLTTLLKLIIVLVLSSVAGAEIKVALIICWFKVGSRLFSWLMTSTVPSSDVVSIHIVGFELASLRFGD